MNSYAIADLIDAAKMNAAHNVMHRGFAKSEINGHTIACFCEPVDSLMNSRRRHYRVRFKMDGRTVARETLNKVVAEVAA